MSGHRWLSKDENAAIARQIEQFCQSKVITHREFAKRNGMAASQLSEYLSGAQRMPIHCFLAACGDMRVAPWHYCKTLSWMQEVAHAA